MRAPFLALLVTWGVLTGCGEKRESEWVRTESSTTQTLTSIHGSGPNDVWAVGLLGTIIHWDGTRWSTVEAGTKVDLNAVWAVGPKDAWAVGERGTVLRWNGTWWSRMEIGEEDYDFVDVWASGPGDVWLTPHSNNGSVFFRGPAHFDGETWTQPSLSTDEYYSGRWRLWGSGPQDVWLMNGSFDGDLMHWTGTAWSAVTTQGGLEPACSDGWGTGPNEFWVLCTVRTQGQGLLLKDATGWKQLPAPAPDGSWNGLWGSGGKVWLVTNGGLVRHFDGNAWTEELRFDFTAPNLNAIWGASASDIWAVGEGGAVARRTPTVSP